MPLEKGKMGKGGNGETGQGGWDESADAVGVVGAGHLRI